MSYRIRDIGEAVGDGPKRISIATKRLIVKAYLGDDLQIKQIAAKFNIHPRTVYKVLKSYGSSEFVLVPRYDTKSWPKGDCFRPTKGLGRMSDSADYKPSWLRWPPNCCETCIGPWLRDKDSEYSGRCGNAASLNYGDKTDSRFRCQDFKRREGV